MTLLDVFVVQAEAASPQSGPQTDVLKCLCHVGNWTENNLTLSRFADLTQTFKNAGIQSLKSNRPRELEGGSETVFRPVFVPRVGCLIVAVVEEAEPQLWSRAGLNSP